MSSFEDARCLQQKNEARKQLPGPTRDSGVYMQIRFGVGEYTIRASEEEIRLIALSVNATAFNMLNLELTESLAKLTPITNAINEALKNRE